jgi:hypothetical protein
LRETFQGKLNTKLESLKLDNVKDGWNNFRKVICEIVDGVLGKKVRNTARNISDNALCLIQKRRGMYKLYLSDRSYENKPGYKIAEYLEMPPDGIIVIYCTGTLINWEENSQSGLVPLKDRNEATISEKEWDGQNIMRIC